MRKNILYDAAFPRASRYDAEWLMDQCYGANPLWLAEWLCQDLELEAGMRVLDLGCGRACSSIFLAREFGLQVCAADLWTDPNANWERIREAGVADLVEPCLADARNLPYPEQHFDAIVAFDSMQYFGTDCLFLPYIVQFLQPCGRLGFASAGVVREVASPLPPHLEPLWTTDYWCLRTAHWWREHWARTGLVDLQLAETMDQGWKRWLHWARSSDCADWYCEAIERDAGAWLGYIRVLAQRRPDTEHLSYDLRTGESY